MCRLAVVALVGLFLVLSVPRFGVADQQRPRIGVVQFGNEPNVEICKQGMLQALEEDGYKDGETVEIIYKNAQADFSLVHSCIQDLVRRKVDVLVPLSTPCLQSAAQAAGRNEDLKVVFTYVFDPYSLGVATTPEDHIPNVTGVSCFVPVERMLDTIKSTFPERKEVGTVWNSSEVNSESVVTRLRDYAPTIGLRLIEATVTGPHEVLDASRSLAGRGARVFLCAGDNTVNVAYDSFAKAAEESRIPVFGVDSELIGGTLIVIGPNYLRNGYDGGKYVSRVLKGEKTSDLPISQTKETNFIINMEAARRGGFNIPPEIARKATSVVGVETGSN